MRSVILDDLQGGGFVLVAQFDFPGGGGEAVVDGGWPFGWHVLPIGSRPVRRG